MSLHLSVSHFHRFPKTNNKIYLITIILLLFIILFLIARENNKNNSKEEIKSYNNIFALNVEKNDNYVFIGDSLTKEFDLNSFYEYKPVINKGDNISTRDIINDIDNLLVKYFLVSISKKFNTTVDEIKKLNNLINDFQTFRKRFRKTHI